MIFHYEYWRVAVEHRHSALMSDLCVSFNDALAGWPPGVYPTSDLHLLRYAQVYVVLSHTAQRRLQVAVVSISDVVWPKTDQRPFLSSPPDLPPLLISGPILRHIPYIQTCSIPSATFPLTPAVFICGLVSVHSFSCLLSWHGVIHSSLVTVKVAHCRGLPWMILTESSLFLYQILTVLK